MTPGVRARIAIRGRSLKAPLFQMGIAAPTYACTYICLGVCLLRASRLAVLEVIAEPTRRRILDAVRDGERSVNELVEQVGMHQPGVSRHLKVLRDAGLVEVRRDAQRRLYRLRPEPLMELDAWLEPYRAEWAGAARFARAAPATHRRTDPPSSKEHR